MLKINLLIAGLLCYAWASYAQTPVPGGVAQPITWITTVQQEDSLYILNQTSSEVMSKRAMVYEEESSILNNHFGYRLKSKEEKLRIVLDNNLDLCNLTVFTVYHSTKNEEQAVWSLSVDDSIKAVLSTHRMADLDQRTYLNFPEPKLGQPVIYSYFQHKPVCHIPSKDQAILFGHHGKYPSLPIEAFEGTLYELIIYNRVLTGIERNQVATYLSLKYGVSLSLASAQQYYNSSTEVIWDNEPKEQYLHRVTGIGKDTLANFYQRQSTNATEQELLVISTSEEQKMTSFFDKSYFIWADNNKPLEWSTENNAQNTLLQRAWLVTTTGIDSTFKVNFKLKKSWLPPLISNAHSYWLLIKNKDDGQQYDSYPLDDLIDRHYLSFSNVSWRKYFDRPIYFTIGIALNPPDDSTKWEIPIAVKAEEALDFSVFPNPISKGGNFQIHLANTTKEPVWIKIENIHGQLITNTPLNGINEYGHLLDLPGLYFVTVYNAKISTTKKVIVQ